MFLHQNSALALDTCVIRKLTGNIFQQWNGSLNYEVKNKVMVGAGYWIHLSPLHF